KEVPLPIFDDFTYEPMEGLDEEQIRGHQANQEESSSTQKMDRTQDLRTNLFEEEENDVPRFVDQSIGANQHGSSKDICSLFDSYLPNLEASMHGITWRMFSTQLRNSSNKNQIKWSLDERVISREFGPNKLNDEFPSWLSSLQELQVLVLRSNAFHGPITKTGFPKLRILDMSSNHFKGILPSDFFVNWTAMFSLATEAGDQSNEKYMGSGYYVASMVLINKGVAMELVRILKIFTAIDVSGNRFEGEIPKTIGLLKELHVLNFTNNSFTGQIPLSMGNLAELESLDVSQNKISGEIPQELGNLSYLAYMNFSHNQLVGLVPGGTQFRTKPCSSSGENLGLHGPLLDEVCVDIHTATWKQSETPELEEEEEEEEEEQEEMLSWIAAAIGFIPGVFFGETYLFPTNQSGSLTFSA
ncbi:unnamed protein product, partial [Brassica napus]